MLYKLIVFDLDGVLLNSRENMKISWECVKKEFKIKNSFEEYFSHIGRPFKDILDNLKIKENQNLIRDLYYKSSIENEYKLILYPDVLDTLIKLKDHNYKLSICTSKNLKRTLRILQNIPVDFDSVNCPELQLKGKPYPDQLLKAIDFAKVSIKETIYIGDTIIDYETALNAKVDFIFAKYGYGNMDNLKVDSIDKIKHLLDFF